MKHIRAGVLDVAYREVGPPDGPPVMLLHGFPYDIHAYDDVAARLEAAGRRCIIPFLRGYGNTRFVSADTPRSGQQAVLAADLLALMDALAIERAVLAGYDWGGRAACIVAALWPERAKGLVSGGDGYNIQNIAKSGNPVSAERELQFWYQYYFNMERGRAGLQANRRDICRLLWRLWSPEWAFDDATFAQSAAAFDNPDFVEVVIHSYRHRYGTIAGDPAVEDIERKLAASPAITVPSIVLHGDADGVAPVDDSADDDPRFTGGYERRILSKIGHNVPQEAPQAFAEACAALS
jgi:pimeloyl-ACP methyl ester carboxylesterase